MKYLKTYEQHTFEDSQIDEGFKDILTGIMLLGAAFAPGKAGAEEVSSKRDFIKNHPEIKSEIKSAINQMENDPTFYNNFLQDAKKLGVDAPKLQHAIKYAKQDVEKSEERGSRYSKKTVNSLEEAVNLMRKGYVLTEYGKEMIKTMKKVEPDPPVPVEVFSVDIDASDLFDSGTYEVSDTARQDLMNSMREIANSVAQQDSVIINISIESSTDTQDVSGRLSRELTKKGYEEGNIGLSQIRNDYTKDALTDVFETLGLESFVCDIDQTVKSETGEGEEHRYVKVNLSVLSIPTEAEVNKEAQFVQESEESLAISLINVYKKYKPKAKKLSTKGKFKPKHKKATMLGAVQCPF